MMSLDSEKVAEEFLELQKFFNEMGFELVGTKDINNEELYLVKKRKFK